MIFGELGICRVIIKAWNSDKLKKVDICSEKSFEKVDHISKKSLEKVFAFAYIISGARRRKRYAEKKN